MAYAWMRVKNWRGDVDLDRFCQDFNVAASDVDQSYGMVPDRYRPATPNYYTVMVEEKHVDRLKNDFPDQFEGPFANVQFAPFGPPQP